MRGWRHAEIGRLERRGWANANHRLLEKEEKGRGAEVKDIRRNKREE